MKKTVQINIAGVLFAIEEDAFDKLQDYLKSIQNYFSAFESSDEIVTDIEARIAERFMKGEDDASAIIINQADVDQVIARMGSVADFQAMEEEVDFKEESTTPLETKVEEPTTAASGETKKLQRDTKRKALGGVLAGFAHYFKLDVTWLRVIFVLLFLGVTPITATAGSGVLLLAYLICWIALPGNDQLEMKDKIKRFYRNPDKKVLGGVSSGLASYFAVDIAIIRLLFVFAGIFGVGIIAYIVLWIGSPMATSLTQKMEMKGEPVTLENIENSVRKNLGVKDQSQENTLTKILLFPFRLISMIFSALGRLLKSLGPVVRVLAGIFIIVIGLSLLVGAFVATAVFFGLTSNHDLFDFGSNVGRLFAEIPKASGIFLFLASVFPGIAATLGGVSLLKNQRVGSRNFWLTSVILWFTGILGLSFYSADYSVNFAKKASTKKTELIDLNSNMLYFDVKENDFDSDIRFETEVFFSQSNTGQLEIERTYTARGKNREVARENTNDILYNISQYGDTLVFDEDIKLLPEANFRDQELTVEVKIPKGVQFKMSSAFADDLVRRARSIRYKYGISYDGIKDLTFELDNSGKLNCVDCPTLSEEEQKALERNRYQRDDFDYDRNENLKKYGENRASYEFRDFEEIEIESSMEAEIRQGATYSVEVVAERRRDLEDLDVDLSNGRLIFEYEDAFFRDRDRMIILITMPDLSELDLSGASRVKVLNFENVNNLRVDLSGASRAAIDVDASTVYVDASGASRAILAGDIDRLEIEANGASSVDTKKCEVNTATVEASGASNVRLGEVNSLSSDASGASSISRE